MSNSKILQHNVSIIILAAGQGTRMKSTTPKVLHKISGKEMLYYIIQEAKKLSDDIHIVLYHQAKLIQKTMEIYFSDLIFHIQDYKNYPGTGGAIMGITPKNKRVLVLNGDMPLMEASELKNLISDEPLTICVLKFDDATGYGRVIIKSNKVTKIVEQKDCNNEELKITTANAGIYCFNKTFLLENLPKLTNKNVQNEYYITDLVEIAVDNKLGVKPVIVKKENFIGINSKLDLANAEVLHQNKIKNNFLRAGVIIRLPNTVYIEDGVEIIGESILENGVTLLGNTKIINSHIKANSVVENSILEDSHIGPMARIRPLSILKNTHIGNFVEVKKSTLNGVKAGHLSYLGDSEINTGTNIGAGTITCNYDGKKKSKTIIGRNVFIGSSTQLIAPLTLEDNCIIGAGSTITKSVKSGQLALTRSKITIIKDYFYRFFQKDE
jgi:bifunctional UDP-N-acetylglucosamine pyrophosphorylase/glucosamine-1-phosphate N-acetyltransferase